MGQKANITTIKKSQIRFSSLEQSCSEYALINIFLGQLHRLFILSPGVLRIKRQVSVYLLNSSIQKTGSKFSLLLDIFFRTKQLVRYRLKLNKFTNNHKSLVGGGFNFLFRFLNRVFSSSLLFLSIRVINNILITNKKESTFLLKNYYISFKRYSVSLFPRRLSAFFDLLKLSFLLFKGKLKISFFIKLLADVFSILQKKKHVRYLQFIKLLFSKLLYTRYKKKSTLLGVKFLLWGKLKGKTRGSTSSIVLGKIPVQTVSANVDYAKCHSYTVYGVFGFKIWLFKNGPTLNVKLKSSLNSNQKTNSRFWVLKRRTNFKSKLKIYEKINSIKYQI